MSDSDDREHQENLRRQHEALRKQLAQIESEMARARDDSASSTKPKASTLAADTKASSLPTPATASAPVAASASSAEDADALLHRYAAEEPRIDLKAVKRGCLLAFVGLLAVFAGGFAAIYFLFYAHR